MQKKKIGQGCHKKTDLLVLLSPVSCVILNFETHQSSVAPVNLLRLFSTTVYEWRIFIALMTIFPGPVMTSWTPTRVSIKFVLQPIRIER